MLLITITTVVANLVVMVALSRVKRAPAHYPLISLVVADLLLGITVMPIAMGRELFVFHLNRYVCSFWSTMDVLCCTASITSLCVLGWERWSAITAPLGLARRALLARRLSLFLWPIAAVVALPTVVIPSPYHHQPWEPVKACTVNTNIRYVFFSSGFSFFVPATVMVAMYVRIIRALAAAPPIRAHRGRSPSRNTTAPTQLLGHSTQALTRTASQDATSSQATSYFIPLTVASLPSQSTSSPSALPTTSDDVETTTSKGPQETTDLATQSASSLTLDSIAPPNTQESFPVPEIPADSPEQIGQHNAPEVTFARDVPITSTPHRLTMDAISVRQRRATRTIVMLMSLFLFCWMPFFIMLPVDSLCECVWDWAFKWSTWLGYTNSALNPMVYAAASRSVRLALRTSFTSVVQNSDIPMTAYRR